MMLDSLWDQKNSSIKKILHKDKVDPGIFSLNEPGWWAAHVIAITGVFILGHRLGKK